MKTATFSRVLPALSLVPVAEPTTPQIVVLPFAVALYRRRKFVLVLRAAFVAWSEAAQAANEAFTAITPSEDAIRATGRRCRHCYHRYTQLEAALASETGLETFSVFNSIAQFPNCSRLLRAGL